MNRRTFLKGAAATVVSVGVGAKLLDPFSAENDEYLAETGGAERTLTGIQATKDISRDVDWLDPDAAPLVTILSRARSMAVHNVKYEWAEMDDERGATSGWNYLQIFATAFGTTATMSMKADPKKLRHRLRVEKAVEHRQDIERSFLFGKRERLEEPYDNSTPEPRRHTGGVSFFEPLQLSYKDSFGDAENFMKEFVHGRTMLVLASPAMTANLDLEFGDKLRLVEKGSTYGITVRQVKTAYGDLNIVKHRLMQGEHAFVLDPKLMGYRYLTGRDTFMRTNLQPLDYDGWTDEYRSEVGFMLAHPIEHAEIR